LGFATTKSGTPVDKIDSKLEKRIAESPVEADPEGISSGSSVRHVFEGSGENKQAEKVGSLKADIETIKETFALTEVPKESLYIGAAGVIPYAATSLSTVVSNSQQAVNQFYWIFPQCYFVFFLLIPSSY